MQYSYEATHLRGNLWAVHPKGQLGTCGWVPYAWTVVYMRGYSGANAIGKAFRKGLIK